MFQSIKSTLFISLKFLKSFLSINSKILDNHIFEQRQITIFSSLEAYKKLIKNLSLIKILLKQFLSHNSFLYTNLSLQIESYIENPQQQLDSIGKCLTCIIIYMLEHLILNGRFESAYQYHQISPRSFKEQLLSNFNKGKRKEFLRLFALLRTEEKLEFYIRVYFLIYNIHPSIKPKGSIPQEQIIAFRQFLQTKGADLAKTNEFLQFYALSYVKKPLEHPSYKSLFKKEWINNLSEKLILFLQQQEKRMKDCIVIGDYDSRRSPQFQSSQAILNSNLKQLEAKNKNLFDEVQAFKRKYHELQRNNQALIESFNSHLMQSQNKWFQITRQLTNNAKVLVDLISRTNSSLIHDRRYQRIKKRTEKFQKIVKKELDQLLNQSQDISVFDKPSANQISYSAASVTPNVSQRNLTTFVTLDEFIPTNYIALIRDFKKMTDTQKIAVLQGLSWRIIKSKNKEVRRQTIIGLIVNDVLGIVNGDIELLMFNPALTYNVLQIFLFISEDSYGKRVLFRNGGLYKQVIDLISQTLKSNNLQSLDLILQILLNIWHSKDIFTELINLKIVDICVNLLQMAEISTNQQLLQSITTILLNATATEEGLSSFQNQINIFYYLSEAFRQSNDSNRNLIGAIMYALLGRKNLWKLAHQANLPTFISDMIQEDRRSNKQQLKIIQSKLHSFQPGKTMDSTQFDDQKSIDSELEQQNFIRNEDELQDLQQYIKGHEMLSAKYALRNKQADKQLEQINKIMNAHDKKNQAQQNVTKDQKNQQATKGQANPQKQKLVHLPQIKKKKEPVEIYNPKNKNKIQQQKQYYSYKSPNFKQNEQKNIVSAQVNREEFIQEYQKPKVHSFEHDSVQSKRANRVFTKPSQISNEASERKAAQERKSAEKPEYRIKKSSSVQKVTNPYRKQTLPYETNKNSSNVADYKSIEGIKSPPQKKSREQVLKQLNQQLKAEKKNQEQERKISNRNVTVGNQGSLQRENTYLKKNNFVAVEEDVKAFESKPKLRRTPPQDEKKEQFVK